MLCFYPRMSFLLPSAYLNLTIFHISFKYLLFFEASQSTPAVHEPLFLNTVALHVTGYPVKLLIATRNNFVMGMMGLLRTKYARVLWVFLQIRTIEHSPDSFERFCSGSRRKLDASRRFFQLRNQGLPKSLFSTATLLPLLENLLRGRGGRTSPSPDHMHTL